MKLYSLFSKTLLLCLIPIAAFAQGGSIGNGGDIDEAYIFGVAKNIELLLKTETGRLEFSEVSPELFAQAIEKTDVKLVKNRITDKNRNVRSAVNFRGETRNLLQFRIKDLKRAQKDPSGASLVILVFHEFLNLMGLELNDDTSAKSIYTISKRITQHAKLILSGNIKALDSEKFGFSSYAAFSLKSSLTIQNQMLAANFLISDLNPEAPVLTKSKMDASVVCQSCSGHISCFVYQQSAKTYEERKQNYDQILNHSGQSDSFQILTQRQLQQQLQQMQQQQQQQQDQLQQQLQQQQGGVQRQTHSEEPWTEEEKRQIAIQQEQAQRLNRQQQLQQLQQTQQNLSQWKDKNPNGNGTYLGNEVSNEILGLLVLKKFKLSEENRCVLVRASLTCIQNEKTVTCFSSQY